jgi:hypothetical protein
MVVVERAVSGGSSSRGVFNADVGCNDAAE